MNTKKMEFSEFLQFLIDEGFSHVASSIEKLKDVSKETLKKCLDETQNYLIELVPTEDLLMLVRFQSTMPEETVLWVRISPTLAFGFHINKETSFDRGQDGEWKHQITFTVIRKDKEESFESIGFEWFPRD